MSEIRVKVTKFGDRKNWLAYYDDPLSGKRKSRSTACERKKDAEKFAAVWEAELRAGKYKPPSNVTWEEFRERLEDEKMAAKSENYQTTMSSALNAFEKACSPKRLADVSADKLSHFVKVLVAEGKPATTVCCYVKHLQSALSWAKKMHILLTDVPKIDLPTVDQDDVSKGHPITTEEFERMLAKVPVALSERIKKPDPKMKMSAPQLDAETWGKVVASWERLLWGLWHSGLRLEESLHFSWDDERQITPLLQGRRPLLHFPAKRNKRRKEITSPMTPDFYRFLLETPEAERTGWVFRLLGKLGGEVRDEDYVGQVISRIGELAGIVVKRDDDEGVKFASAHDLRRSFGDRCAKRMMPPALKQLMRHRSIETTMRHYTSRNAEDVADTVWAAFETDVNTFVNSQPFPASDERNEKAANPCE